MALARGDWIGPHQYWWLNMATLPLTLGLHQVQLTDDQFYQLCVNNPDLKLERDRHGGLILMSPVGGEGGSQEASYIIDLGLWNRQTGLGLTFSSSTMFRLPKGGERSPDAAWVEQSRWDALTPEQRRQFPPLAPDFVLELRSRSDPLTLLRDKMQEYRDSGVRLGWLINPQDQQVEIYRPGQAVEVRSLPTELSGEAVLPGFRLAVIRF
jgi:Uma2 family endonuclease